MFGDRHSSDNPVATDHPQFLGAHTTNRARAALVARKERRRHFAASMFSESGWDMLLTLYIAESEGDALKIGELTRRSGVSATTVFRWLNYLEEQGLVNSVAAPSDVGPTPIKLTEQAIESLDAYFATIPTI
jgi:DNA-binding MarR family transcriptional regulator